VGLREQRRRVRRRRATERRGRALAQGGHERPLDKAARLEQPIKRFDR
jgi:hypothetical protein